MREINVKLKERIKRVLTIESFRFVPEEKIEFSAGQFAQVIFDEENKANKDLNKYLSFSCSPTKEYIELTKRLSESNFSKKLRALNAGDTVKLKLPMGACTLKEGYEKICLLAGGIGITPVISIIEYIVDKKLHTDVVLFYSNRTEEIAFKKELDSWRSNHCNIKIIYTVSSCQPKDSSCIFGVIDKNLVLANVDQADKRIFFIFGPPAMVEAMKVMCLELGVKPQNIKTESFIGY
ncbi:MAG: FAD-dependent oxidoreductase [Candidatus Omnitrophica bacterium]|nr:FAD-dependent oxidoreductase [Candidatus Omnitrophota bacterium]